MSTLKNILIPILSLIFLSNPIIVNYCSATVPLAGAARSSFSYDEDHPSHHETTCHDNSPCQTSFHCCNLAVENVVSYLFDLDSHLLNFVETPFRLVEATRPLYHPPRTLL